MTTKTTEQPWTVQKSLDNYFQFVEVYKYMYNERSVHLCLDTFFNLHVLHFWCTGYCFGLV